MFRDKKDRDSETFAIKLLFIAIFLLITFIAWQRFF